MKKNKIYCSFSRGKDFCVVLESAADRNFRRPCKITYFGRPSPNYKYFSEEARSEVDSNYEKHIEGEIVIPDCKNCKIRFKCYTNNILKVTLDRRPCV